ncbi:MAG TPA: protein kinase [Gemmataceae bacterium]|nr:protein kinase [Gemmataceae bacterium]
MMTNPSNVPYGETGGTGSTGPSGLPPLPDATPPPPSPGFRQRQLGPYLLLEPIGAGGMGTVYRALHTRLNKVMAVKLLPLAADSASAVARFRQEMLAAGQLRHPNIVEAYDAGEVDGVHYLAMEYVEGIDLAQLVRQRGPLSVADACELVRQTAIGLQHAYEHGLVHRDIKPSNLMLTLSPLTPTPLPPQGERSSEGPPSPPRGERGNEGFPSPPRGEKGDEGFPSPSRGERGNEGFPSPSRGERGDEGFPSPPLRGRGVRGEGAAVGLVKILDLGLARLHAPAGEGEALTAYGQIMGTPDYMAPEQIYDSHTVDIRGDLYSLGCTLYCLLTGRPPFAGPGCETIAQKRQAHLQQPPPPIRIPRPDVPPALEAVLDRLLAKEPAQRFATPIELAAALEPFTAGCDLAALLGRGSAGGPALAETVLVPPGPTGPAPSRQPILAGRRRQAAAAVLLASGLIAGAVALWQFLNRGAGRPPLEVSELHINHYRKEDSAVLGRLANAPAPAVRFGDLVRVSIRLNQPAHFYLVALNPDGKDQLCYPAEAAALPEKQETLDYPANPGDGFVLNDGVGLQAFVVIASDKLLPSYDEWKARGGAPPWPAGAPGDAWTYDGRRFAPLGSSPRGDVQGLPVPAAFRELCRFLQERPDAGAVRAVCFPVRPREAPKP